MGFNPQNHKILIDIRQNLPTDQIIQQFLRFVNKVRKYFKNFLRSVFNGT